MAYSVVMPLEIAGEATKYPSLFEQMGVSFTGRRCSSDDEVIALAAHADAVITEGSQRPMPRKVIENLPCCRIIAGTQIGFDTFDIEAAAERGILVTNVPGYCLEEVSDHAMALVLACARQVVSLNEAAKRGEWGFGPNSAHIKGAIRSRVDALGGKTLGVFGFGAIGRSLVPRAKGFRMRVIACDPFVDSAVVAGAGAEKVDWPTLLRESDFLSIHAALSGETRHAFDDAAFAQMKASACLVNTARGGFVDEEALYRALTEGRLAMAALDVLELEPPQNINRLLTLDNVISTAHSAFYSPRAVETQWLRPVREIARVFRGRWPVAVVNPAAKQRFVERFGPMKDPDAEV
jgi:D-3-phosphoglycerate dehydrogenase